jgi:hypothetical protein
MTQEEQGKHAFFLSLAALLGEKVFNFGELLAHKVSDCGYLLTGKSSLFFAFFVFCERENRHRFFIFYGEWENRHWFLIFYGERENRHCFFIFLMNGKIVIVFSLF